jgi:uncharacterized protein YbjQ (UPF0145 family)
MKKCISCGSPVELFEISDGKCYACNHSPPDGVAELTPQARTIILTTEASHNLPVDQRLDIISSEVVIGLHIFKDIASLWRDAFGGRSKVMQDGLREARKTALDELRREAALIGADAVVGIDLDYSEISGGGKSMLFLVATGTAVTLRNGSA